MVSTDRTRSVELRAGFRQQLPGFLPVRISGNRTMRARMRTRRIFRGYLKLKAPHIERCSGAEVLLFGFAVNCSAGIEPALHDGLPCAAGAGKHAQQNRDRRGENPVHRGILDFPLRVTRGKTTRSRQARRLRARGFRGFGIDSAGIVDAAIVRIRIDTFLGNRLEIAAATAHLLRAPGAWREKGSGSMPCFLALVAPRSGLLASR